MLEDIKENISDWVNDEEIKDYLTKMMNKEVFDKSRAYIWIGPCGIYLI